VLVVLHVRQQPDSPLFVTMLYQAQVLRDGSLWFEMFHNGHIMPRIYQGERFLVRQFSPIPKCFDVHLHFGCSKKSCFQYVALCLLSQLQSTLQVTLLYLTTARDVNVTKRSQVSCHFGSSLSPDYELDGPGSNPSGYEIFRPSRPALRSTQPPVKWAPGLSRR